jgi:hypothetical protein
MFYLVLIGIIVIIAIAVGYVLRQNQLSATPNREELPPLERTLFTLQIGDIVQYFGTDWVVEGQLTYNEDGFTWLEYMLQDGDRISWLSVEEDDLLEVQWLEPTNALEVGSNPPKELKFEDEIFRCVSSGVALMKRKGNLQRRRSEECHYYDYEGPGDRVLSIEEWDGEIEVTIGENIRPSSLSLLPGTGGSVYRN